MHAGGSLSLLSHLASLFQFVMGTVANLSALGEGKAHMLRHAEVLRCVSGMRVLCMLCCAPVAVVGLNSCDTLAGGAHGIDRGDGVHTFCTSGAETVSVLQDRA